MKAIIKLNDLEMVIENKSPGQRPTITGDLWDLIKPIPFDAWYLDGKHWPSNRFPEIDLALSFVNIPMFNVVFEQPIEFYESDGFNIA